MIIKFSNLKNIKGVKNLKTTILKTLTLTLASVLLFSTATSANTINPNDTIIIENQHEEVFYDEQGNETKLEYIQSSEELIVNTYVNGELIDYSVREIENNEFSSVITNYIVEPVDSTNSISIDKDYKITNTKSYQLEESNELKQPSISLYEPMGQEEVSTLATVPGGLKWVRSLYHTGYKLTGHLYKGTTGVETTYKGYSFVSGIAISVIASAITFVFSKAIVAVGVLLASLAIPVAWGKITKPLSGSYSATHTYYDYLVQVNSKNVLFHSHNIIGVRYYSTNTGKQYIKNVYSSSHLPEPDILSKGITRYANGYR